MNALVGGLVALLLAGPALVGCMVGGECFHPIATYVTAGVLGPPGSAPSDLNLGACGQWMRFEGRQYTLHPRYPDRWTLTDAALEPIGRATEATSVAGPFSEDTVYAIEGVDRRDAVAMHAASPRGEIIVFRSNTSFPEALCGWFEQPPVAETPCRSPGASPPAPTAAPAATG